MATGDRIDPFSNFNFTIEIEGLVAGGFSEVSGLQAEIEVQEYREGGLNEYMHRFSGPVKYPGNLVLKRGLTDATVLWSWYRDVMRGPLKKKRKNVSVVLVDSSGEEKWRWNFQNAYPVKWVGPNMRASASEIAVETLELAHEGLQQQ